MFALFKAHRTVVFQAAGISRLATVTDDAFMTIEVRRTAWWLMDKRRKEGRPQEVAFPLIGIRGGWYRPASWYRPGVLVLQVPNAGDPWRRRTDRQRRKNTYPAERAHKLRFTARQEPAFARLAREIGMDGEQDEATS